MASRLSLQGELEALLGSRDVYFQPPESVRINHPAIVYFLSNIGVEHADDQIYKLDKVYTVIFITSDPDESLVTDLLLHFPKCRFDRSYIADELNHYVYTLYY